MWIESAYFALVLTLLAYQAGLWIRRKTKTPLASPMLAAVALIIICLLALGVPVEAYTAQVRPLQILLTPATVALAIPLYKQLALLRRHPVAILGGIGAGTLTALASVWALSRLFGLSQAQYITLLPKSITTAIGMGLSEKMGGMATITVLAIAITGICGNMLAETLCRLFGIKDPMAQGLAIGTSAHALGTAKAMELGAVQGAMGSLAIVVAGVMTVVLVPLFALL